MKLEGYMKNQLQTKQKTYNDLNFCIIHKVLFYLGTSFLILYYYFCMQYVPYVPLKYFYPSIWYESLAMIDIAFKLWRIFPHYLRHKNSLILLFFVYFYQRKSKGQHLLAGWQLELNRGALTSRIIQIRV